MNRGQFWIVVSDPAQYKIIQIEKNKSKIVSWDANYCTETSKIISTMKPRDKVLFFASGEEMAFTGLLEVYKVEPNPRQDDPFDKYYYTEEPKIWNIAKLILKKRFDTVIPLKSMKAGDKLQDFALLNQTTSTALANIYSITEAHYKYILTLSRKLSTNKTENEESSEEEKEEEEPQLTIPLIKAEEITNLDPLGSGNFGTVFKGFLRHQHVAVKKLNIVPSKMSRNELIIFKREVDILHNSTQKNIVKFLGAVIDDSNLMIITELVTRGELGKLLQDKQIPLGMDVKLGMIRDVALGMNWLHSSTPQFLHRDLKPSNLLVGENFSIKICDFGFSQTKDPLLTTVTKDAGLTGTLIYMAPELLRGEDFCEKIDVYSFALIMWEILTREPLYPQFGNHDGSVFRKCVLEENLRPTIPPDTHPALVSLLSQCWHHDAKSRPSFSEILKQVDDIMLEVCISDPVGRKVWQHAELKGQTRVPWNTFLQAMQTELHDGLEARFNKLPQKTTSEELRRASDRQLNFYSANGVDQATQVQSELKRRYGSSRVPVELFTDNDELNINCLKALIAKQDSDGQEYVSISAWGDTIRWFAPLVDPNGQVNFFDRIRRILSNEYFHGDISQEEANSKLSGQHKGVFLVRFSSMAGKYTVSSIPMDERQVKCEHRRLSYKNGEIVYKQQKFASLEALIYALKHSKLIGKACRGSKYAVLFKTSVSNYVQDNS